MDIITYKGSLNIQCKKDTYSAIFAMLSELSHSEYVDLDLEIVYCNPNTYNIVLEHNGCDSTNIEENVEQLLETVTEYHPDTVFIGYFRWHDEDNSCWELHIDNNTVKVHCIKIPWTKNLS